MKKVLILAMIAAASLGSAQAAECSKLMVKWDKTVTATKPETVSVVNDSANARYEGLCSLKAASGKFAEATLNGAGKNIFLRFYVFARKAQSNATIFALGNGASDVVKGVWSGDELSVGSAKATMKPGNWHLVQVQINGKDARLWIDDVADTPTASGTVNAVTAKSLKLGSLDSSSGDLFFDSVVVSNGKKIGNEVAAENYPKKDKGLLAGDANGDSTLDVGDITAVFEAAFGGKPEKATGAPDCNRDGVLDVGDITCIFEPAFAGGEEPKF